MSHFSNRTTDTLSPTTFREALQRMCALRDTPVSVIDRLYIDRPYWLDMQRIIAEDPALATAIAQSQQENAGEIVMPPDVYERMFERGFMVFADEAGDA